MVVHSFGHLVVLKALALHHVAPVARTVANADQQRAVGFLGQPQRLGSPGQPLHRVVGMLQQVGAALVDKCVGSVVRHGQAKMRAAPSSCRATGKSESRPIPVGAPPPIWSGHGQPDAHALCAGKGCFRAFLGNW